MNVQIKLTISLPRYAVLMEYEGFVVVVVNCWYCREIPRFVSDSFVFLPHSLFIFLFVCRSCKGIKDGRKKTRISLDSKFIWRFTILLWCEMFSWTSRNSHAHLTRRLKNLMESSLVNCRFECPSYVSVFSGYV